MKIKIKFESDQARDIYQNADTRGIEWNAGDSGIDLRSVEDDFELQPFETRIIKSGIALEITDCDTDLFEVQLRPRSSLTKRGIVGHFGTIDFTFRGFMGMSVTNITNQPIEIKRGERIKQMIVAPILKPKIEFADELGQTVRSDGGFGSTGKM
ncbi:MAG: dUTP diphosphatase [Rickettsiales bacterium]|jgi:dUTP pyrophosphatase|nr:dUTP diphosphatase [Rickettsiales bacterium]